MIMSGNGKADFAAKPTLMTGIFLDFFFPLSKNKMKPDG